MDEKDPNYDSDSLDNGDVTIETIVPQLSHAEINKHLEPIILEYYSHGDTKEVGAQLFFLCVVHLIVFSGARWLWRWKITILVKIAS